MLRCLSGIYKTSEGEVRYNDENVYDNPNIKENIGFVADENTFFYNFKVKEVLKYYKYAFDKPTYEEDLELKGVFKISKVGRVFTIITEQYDEEFIKALNKFNPLFMEEIDLSLEDIFIYKVDKEENNEKIFK
ncbi:Uncharacterised protein [Clostridioides difficile]|nr:Uncharacterised protein [Clostridioides difficile]